MTEARETISEAEGRLPQRHGERHPGAGDGRRAGGKVGPPGHADGHGGRRHRAVPRGAALRRRRSRVAQPRPLRACRPATARCCFIRCSISPAIRAWTSSELKRFRQLGAKTAGHPEYGHAARHRDDHRPARPGPRQRRRHGAVGAPAERAARRRHHRPPHLRHRRRRLPHGRHQPRGDIARRPSRPRQADRAVRRQRHLH